MLVLLFIAQKGATVPNRWERPLRSEIPGRVMTAPSSGTEPNELMECARERRLVIESRLNRDVDQRHAGLAHQLLGVVNATLNQPPVSGGAERGFE